MTFAIRLRDAELSTFHPAKNNTELFGSVADQADKWKKDHNDKEYLTGTIDYYMPEVEGETAWIDDLKTGRWPVDWKKSRQLRSYALVPWIQAGCPKTGWECHVSITQWPKYPLDALPVRTGGTLLALDLMEHLDDLRWTVAHPEEANAGLGFSPSVENPCGFCQNREEVPASEWMKSWKFSRLPTCWEGAVSLLRNGKLQKEEEENG